MVVETPAVRMMGKSRLGIDLRHEPSRGFRAEGWPDRFSARLCARRSTIVVIMSHGLCHGLAKTRHVAFFGHFTHEQHVQPTARTVSNMLTRTKPRPAMSLHAS
jgi:hypothetical protein